MIIFTEHNEVVMSVDDMRNLIRQAVQLARAASDEQPSTFVAESLVRALEKQMRREPHSMEVS